MLCWEANRRTSTTNLLCSSEVVWFWTQPEVWWHLRSLVTWCRSYRYLWRSDIHLTMMEVSLMVFQQISTHPPINRGWTASLDRTTKRVGMRRPNTGIWCQMPQRWVKTSLRGWQIEGVTSSRHILHSSWWSCRVHWGIPDVSEHLGFYLYSTPGPVVCSPVVATQVWWVAQTEGNSWAGESVGFTFDMFVPEELTPYWDPPYKYKGGKKYPQRSCITCCLARITSQPHWADLHRFVLSD